MTEVDVVRICEIIDDYNARNLLRRNSLYQHGRYCVLGALLHEAGIPAKELEGRGEPCEVVTACNFITREVEQDGLDLLKRVYGVDHTVAFDLMEANDFRETTPGRSIAERCKNAVGCP